MTKRKNKSKRDVVSDIQLTQDAERRRALIRDVIFPYLQHLNESVAYSKIFLQAASGLIEGVYEERRKKTTIGEITPRLNEKLDEVFAKQDEEKKRYKDLIDKLGDVSVQDFAYAAELARYIDGFLVKRAEKENISTVSINEILG